MPLPFKSTRVTTCSTITIQLTSLSSSLLHCSTLLSTLSQNDLSQEPQTNLPNMPLVVPGLTSNSGDNDQTNKWMNDLVGKKLGDSSNETVR